MINLVVMKMLLLVLSLNLGGSGLAENDLRMVMNMTDEISKKVEPIPAEKQVWEVVFEKTKASWYGPGFHGRRTANGEIYNQYDLTFARQIKLKHKLPFNCKAKITNLTNGKYIIARCNDVGPLRKGRSVDLSRACMEALDGMHAGVIPVKIEILTE